MKPTQFGNLHDHKYINNKKVIMKPWGKEIWLELNDKYCYKRIFINAGFKTSYQIHNFKLETNFIIEGTAEVWLENDDNIVEKFIMNRGDFFTVIPNRKHRVIAITDIILQEVSTPEVDDVIRINDEFNRSDGKINEEHLKPVVCILAAGTGSRLGKLTETSHKTLLPLNSKSIISNIINKFDSDHEIIIAVGHLKEQVIEFVNLYHKDKNINFIDVDPHEGIGSGPAFSLECCRKKLQRPFYFCVSDFYTEEKIQNINFSNRNWISIKNTNIPELYSTIEITNGKVTKLINKNKNGFLNAFSGIFYMYDYKLFWNQFDKNVDNDKEVVDVFKDITLFDFTVKEIKLEDMGTSDLYFKLIEKYEGANLHLHKTKFEHKYKLNNKFIKSGTKQKIDKLFIRAEHINKYIPKLTFKGDYFFSYEHFEGNTLYQLDNKEIYIKFLYWFETEFCKNIKQNTNIALTNNAHNFYKDKTYIRLNLIKSNFYFNELDNINKINNRNVLKIDKYLEQINWNDLTDIIPTTKFHGDLQFDNILYCDNSDNNDNFMLIDWREDFGGNTQYGDLYYDLAKLYGGMILNYLKMKESKNYSHIVSGNSIILKHYQDKILENILNNEFKLLVEKHNLDLNKIKLLTSIIFLNMAPLHINEFDKFLFLKSKYLFSEIFKSKTIN
jgi:NDP-sugar pyrophosphorylase family protein/mannose-6-phosphate isomerase-like protein (cupin superfamily)